MNNALTYAYRGEVIPLRFNSDKTIIATIKGKEYELIYDLFFEGRIENLVDDILEKN